MPTNIVFDFGAVLFSWRPELLLREQFAQQASDDARARELASHIFHHADWIAFDGGTLEQAEVIQRTAHRLQLPETAVRALVEGIAPRLSPIDGTLVLLDTLVQRRGGRDDVRLYYLSNMPVPYARYLQQQHDFIGQFDGGVFSGDVQLVKPQPEIFRLLEQRYALQPDHTVFIDDLQINVEAARARLAWHSIPFAGAVAGGAGHAPGLSGIRWDGHCACTSEHPISHPFPDKQAPQVIRHPVGAFLSLPPDWC
ncbi:MAG: HAD family phosphatase [Burkholderiaceae bacterium]